MRPFVEFEVADPQHILLIARPRRYAAPQSGLDPGDHLVEVERLRHIVIPAEAQPREPVIDLVTGGEEDHRGVDALAPDLLDDGETVEVGQHDVEYDRIEVLASGQSHRFAARTDSLGVPPANPAGHDEEFGEVRFVIDDEDACRRVLCRSHRTIITLNRRWDRRS